MEPSNLNHANNLRPDGVSNIPFRRGKYLAWDVTFPHTLSVCHLNKQTGERGGAANDAETKKLNKYCSLVEQYEFVPIAIETLGPYGKHAHSFIANLGRRLQQKTVSPFETIYLRQRISLAIQRGNARTLDFSLR